MHNAPELFADHTIVQHREVEGPWLLCTPYTVMTPPPDGLTIQCVHLKQPLSLHVTWQR